MAACLLMQSSAGAVGLKGGKLSVKLTYRSMYDNNVLRYSVRDRDQFLDNCEPRRSNIRTLDDIRSDFKLSASYAFDSPAERRTRLSATGNFAHHLMNPIKNFGWISLTANRELSGTMSTSLNYFFDINYYIRDYRDVHTGERRHCEFSMDQWTFKVFHRPVKAIEFVAKCRVKKYAYNEYFTEYDSDYIEAGGEIIYRKGVWRLSGGYSFADNENIGFQEIYKSSGNLDIEDSEEGQGDYQQDIYKASVRYAFHVAQRRSRILLEASLKDRYYSTDLDIVDDPMHSGRRDMLLLLELSEKFSINKRIEVEIGSAFSNRRSRSPNPTVSQVKDYDRAYGWIEFGYQLR